MPDLVRARATAGRVLSKARQHLQGFLLRHERVTVGPAPGRRPIAANKPKTAEIRNWTWSNPKSKSLLDVAGALGPGDAPFSEFDT